MTKGKHASIVLCHRIPLYNERMTVGSTSVQVFDKILKAIGFHYSLIQKLYQSYTTERRKTFGPKRPCHKATDNSENTKLSLPGNIQLQTQQVIRDAYAGL